MKCKLYGIVVLFFLGAASGCEKQGEVLNRVDHTLPQLCTSGSEIAMTILEYPVLDTLFWEFDGLGRLVRAYTNTREVLKVNYLGNNRLVVYGGKDSALITLNNGVLERVQFYERFTGVPLGQLYELIRHSGELIELRYLDDKNQILNASTQIVISREKKRITEIRLDYFDGAKRKKETLSNFDFSYTLTEGDFMPLINVVPFCGRETALGGNIYISASPVESFALNYFTRGLLPQNMISSLRSSAGPDDHFLLDCSGTKVSFSYQHYRVTNEYK